MSAEMAQNGNGRFHCLKCGRRHNRSGDIGAYHHRGLDVAREGFKPKTVAVGIAFVRAAEDRDRLTATIDEIKSEFEALDFDEQFPGVDVGQTINEWEDNGIISDVRHTGKHWFEFLANRRKPSGMDRSPDSFRVWMKKYASNFERARVR